MQDQLSNDQCVGYLDGCIHLIILNSLSIIQ